MMRAITGLVALMFASAPMAAIDESAGAGASPVSQLSLEEAVVSHIVDAGDTELPVNWGQPTDDGDAVPLARVQAIRSPSVHWPLLLLAVAGGLFMAVPRNTSGVRQH